MAKKQSRKVHGPPRKQPDLPTLEDRAIAPLEAAAEEYAALRDQRMILTRDEVALRTKVLKAMRAYHKTIYRRNGMLIEVVAGDETVKVKVRTPDGANAEA